eukprot:1968781-Pyramimonas_sp.AAC.1
MSNVPLLMHVIGADRPFPYKYNTACTLVGMSPFLPSEGIHPMLSGVRSANGRPEALSTCNDVMDGPNIASTFLRVQFICSARQASEIRSGLYNTRFSRLFHMAEHENR